MVSMVLVKTMALLKKKKKKEKKKKQGFENGEFEKCPFGRPLFFC